MSGAATTAPPRAARPPAAAVVRGEGLGRELAGRSFRCTGCGYGVTLRRELLRCPMCGGTSWEEAGSGAGA